MIRVPAYAIDLAVSSAVFSLGLAGGTVLEPRQGVIRALVFPPSFLLFGLGFLGILVQREHRALHDLIAGTAVIYACDARAARLRFLAREAEFTPQETPATGPGPAPRVSPAAGPSPSGIPRR